MKTIERRKRKYDEVVLKLNHGIDEFNKYLSKDKKIPLIDISKLNDDEYFKNIERPDWYELHFPNSDKHGVYFIFGYNDKLKEISLYIGKASSPTSYIGNRMVRHLSKDKENEHYFMYDLNGHNHILEYCLSIDLDKNDMTIFSPALEEFLISYMQKETLLLNGSGNRRKYN